MVNPIWGKGCLGLAGSLLSTPVCSASSAFQVTGSMAEVTLLVTGLVLLDCDRVRMC